MGDFERWTNVGITGVASSRPGPPWTIFGASACLAMIFLAMVAFRSGVFRGALVAVGLVGLVLLFLRTWFILTARTRRYLVAHPDWDDNTRLAVLLGTYVLILVVGAVTGFTLIVVMGALDRIAKGTGATTLGASAPGIGLGFVLVGAIMWFPRVRQSRRWLWLDPGTGCAAPTRSLGRRAGAPVVGRPPGPGAATRAHGSRRRGRARRAERDPDDPGAGRDRPAVPGCDPFLPRPSLTPRLSLAIPDRGDHRGSHPPPGDP